MAKINFDQLWQAFPDHVTYPSLEDLYGALGGQAERNIYVPGFGPNGNTCASRLSVAFNNSGYPINSKISGSLGILTLGTASGPRIIIRVAEFRKYLLSVLGKPTIDNSSPYDDSFKGRRGIISFRVNWGDASGHIALWNGYSYREPGHDNYAAYVNSRFPEIKTSRGEFWEIK
jgi:hypothetical protein